MTWLVAALLALGILPSMTALSDSFAAAFPSLFQYSGPLNPLKIGLPVLLYYGIREWKNVAPEARRVFRWLLGLLALGTVATLIVGVRCQFPSSLLREWFIIASGALAAACLLLLPTRQRNAVFAFWGIAVFGSAAADWLWPSSVRWLLAHIFDPHTRQWDVLEIGRPMLTGIYGRQSLAKLLAWLPWLLLANAWQGSASKKFAPWLLVILAVFASGATLATSQRGPFVAAVAGWLFFILHQALRARNTRGAVYGMLGLSCAALVTIAVVPRDVLDTRLRSLVGLEPTLSTPYSQTADGNRRFRILMNQFSFQIIGENPFGNACIHDQLFYNAGVFPAHAHSLFLEQFRTRGWIWGSAHLLLWIAALGLAWRKRTLVGSFLVAGVVTVLVSGLFDHPWNVLNHSMLLWTLLGMVFLPTPNKPHAEKA